MTIFYWVDRYLSFISEFSTIMIDDDVGSGRPSALQVIFTLSVTMATPGTLSKVVLFGLTKKKKDKSATRKFKKNLSIR